MKLQANKHRRDFHFEVGDKVFVKLQPYHQSSVAFRSSHKLSRKYYGPFEVLERVGQVAYKLLLPPSSKIHPVFHISLLKKSVGAAEPATLALPNQSTLSAPVITPLAVLNQRTIIRKKQHVPQLLIQWEGLSPEDTTWEDMAELARSYPSLNLEDKVLRGELGNVMTTNGNLGPHKEKGQMQVTQEEKDTFTQEENDTFPAAARHTLVDESDSSNDKDRTAMKEKRVRKIPSYLHDYV